MSISKLAKEKFPGMFFFNTLSRINYKGYIGIDVGGAESDVDDLDKAYLNTAAFIEKKWFDKK